MGPRFSIDRWAAWAPGLTDQASWREWFSAPALACASEETTPALLEMPAMMRRRVDRLGRAALQVTYWLGNGALSGPLIFASRYGDMERTLRLLQQLAAGDGLSPTDFSMSVHNAVGALFSIATQDTRPYTAIAAGEETVEAAFIEALSMLSDGAPCANVIYYEAPLPAPLDARGASTPLLHAWACQLSLGPQANISLSPAEPTEPTRPNPGPADLAILDFLSSDTARYAHATPHRQWIWQRHAK